MYGENRYHKETEIKADPNCVLSSDINFRMHDSHCYVSHFIAQSNVTQLAER